MRLDMTLVPARGPARHALALSVALGTMAGAVGILQADRLVAAIDGVFVGRATAGALVGPLLAFAAASVLRAAMGWGAELAAQHAAVRVKIALRDELTGRLVERGPDALLDEQTGEVVNTAVDGIESADAYVAQYLPTLALSFIVPAIVAAAIFASDQLSALVLVLTYPLIPLFMYLVGGAARERTRERWVELSRLSARFVEALQGFVTLKAFGRSEEEGRAIAEGSSRFRALTMDVLKLAFLSALVLELLATLGTAIVAVEVGLRLLYARIAFADALFVLMLAPEFYKPLRALGASFHAGMAGEEAAARIRVLLETGTSPSGPAGDTVVAPAFDRPPHLEFDAVTLTYRRGSAPALDDIHLVIEPGETVALVGRSGSGKSSLAWLVLGFVAPSSGEIRLDGHPLEACGLDAVRAATAWVPQRPWLFHGTLRDNVLAARPSASAVELERALARAHVDEFLDQLPEGVDTIVGERGERLSGGQAQRVALARAFLRDAPLLILDEATAHLDPGQESLVQDSMTALRRNRTVLLIAHRLHTVMEVGRVVVLSHGRVVEFGAPRTLVARGGPFADLVGPVESA